MSINLFLGVLVVLTWGINHSHGLPCHMPHKQGLIWPKVKNFPKTNLI